RTALELPIMITLRSARLEEDRHHALLDRALDDARATRKEPEHAVILAEHVGAEAREPALGPRANHLVEEHGPESQPLVAVLEHDVPLDAGGVIHGRCPSHAVPLEIVKHTPLGSKYDATRHPHASFGVH